MVYDDVQYTSIVCKSMPKIGTAPDSESQICMLTGFGTRSAFLVFGTGFGVNFSDSAHLCCAAEMGTELDSDRSGSEIRLHFSDPEPDLSFWEKSGSGAGIGFCMNGMV